MTADGRLVRNEEPGSYIVNTKPVGVWRPEDTAMALAAISDGEAALERALEIADIISLRDKAAAVGLFLVAQHMTEAAQHAKIFQLKAERKAGAWLTENVADPNAVRWHDETGLPEGIDKNTSHRWQLEASLPDDRFLAYIDECLAHSWELTGAGLRRLADNYNGKHGMEPGERDVLLLKRIFNRWWPDDGTPDRVSPDRDRAYALMVELSDLVIKADAKAAK